MVPLCSFNPPHHWALGSSAWAEPLLLKIIDKILRLLGREAVIWDEGNWQRVLQGPPPLRTQMDTWSCGLFVTMKVDAIARNLKNEEILGNDGLSEMRKKVVNLLLELPIIRYTNYSASDSSAEDLDGGVWVEEGGVLALVDKYEISGVEGTKDAANLSAGEEVDLSCLPDNLKDDVFMKGVDESGGTEETEDAVMVDVSQEGDGGGQNAKVDIPLLEESRKRALSSSESINITEANVDSTSKNKKPCGAKRSVEERRKALEDDAWIEKGSLYTDGILAKPIILDYLGFSSRTIDRILALWNRTGDVIRESNGIRGCPRKLHHSDVDYLKTLVQHRPDWFLDELQHLLLTNRFIAVHLSTIHRELVRAGFSYKTITKLASERNENLRADFVQRMANYQPEQLGFLDEMSKDEWTSFRARGRSQKNSCARQKGVFVRGRRFSAEGLLTLDGMIANTIVEGSMTRDLYLHFLEFTVMPLCSPFPGILSVLVMDNARIHHGEEILELAERFGQFSSS
ncbi:hypothetical protein CVT24_012145 [Panaeolus cyanescens]|uniref:Tc1-like transposase DDE domain-containing protein n=1 Tax=Panaeolus cyanescens TaxID=181874 RepID=A0A409YYQ1_9AGAR|nr:hypothetical protein CVT24_012145 [Panaeolus cyanescens]